MVLHLPFENFMEFILFIVSMLILLYSLCVRSPVSTCGRHLWEGMVAVNIFSASHMTNKIITYFE